MHACFKVLCMGLPDHQIVGHSVNHYVVLTCNIEHHGCGVMCCHPPLAGISKLVVILDMGVNIHPSAQGIIY